MRVATGLTANASDQGELPVLLDTVKERFDAQPATVLADAGYCNERDLTDLETRGVDGYVAPGREGKQSVTRNLEKHPATGRMRTAAPCRAVLLRPSAAVALNTCKLLSLLEPASGLEPLTC